MDNQKQISDTSRKLGRLLIDYGIKFIQSAFHLSPVIYTASDVRNFLNQYNFPSISLSDEKYYVVDWNDWLNIIETDWIGEHQYMADRFDCMVPTELAWAWGLFLTDGSCSLRNKNRGSGASWRITNSNLEYLEKAKEAFKWEYKDWGLDFVIKSYPSYSAGRKTNVGERKKTIYCLDVVSKREKRKENIVVKSGKHKGEKFTNQERNILKPKARMEFIELYKQLFYDPLTGFKIVPKPIHDVYPEPKRAFLEGVWAGDGRKTGYSKYITIGKNNKRLAVELGSLAFALNWNFSINYYKNEIGFRFTPNKNKPLKWNCDNFAFNFSSYASYVFDLNSAGVCYGQVFNKDTNKFLGGHAFNLILALKDGKLTPILYEPMTRNWTVWQAGQNNILGNWKYDINWIIYI
jgi:hypothetical protein